MKRSSLITVAILVAMSLSGCIVVAAAAGATGVYYLNGVAEKSYPYNVTKTYDEVLAALQEASIVPYQKGADLTSGTIEATLSNGKTLKIKLQATGEKVTKVKMRVGTFGDRETSEFLFTKIDKRLQ